ncbi:VpsD family glycosyltransferase [Vibrio atypicus]|uniref:VpsD family glycosyltransferase n=1 Tax=Vibrio atypicus TaxID=558271 RepID=UPI001356B448|nr:VpsD family glycosyltransferase [Vibrio atypicus]
MKKVLVISPLSTTDWGSTSAGGVDSVCQMLLKQLHQSPSNKFSYRVVAFDPMNKVIQEGVIEKLNSNLEIVKFNVKNDIKLNRFVPNLVYQNKKIKEQILDFSPDLIHSHLNSWVVCLGTNISKVLTLHSYKKICRKRGSFLNNFLYEIVIPFLANKSISRYTSVSEYLKYSVEGETKRQIDVVYNPIDDRYFKPVFRTNTRTIELVTCAVITKRKGIHHLVEVVKKLKEAKVPVRLKVIGPVSDSSYYEHLCKVIRQYGLVENIHFMGAKSTEEIINFYVNSDIGVFLSEEETFGLVPLEMIASKLPVICSNTGVISDLSKREQENELLNIVEPNDYLNIAKLVQRLNKHSQTYGNEMIKEEFSVESIINRYESIYLNELISND